MHKIKNLDITLIILCYIWSVNTARPSGEEIQDPIQHNHHRSTPRYGTLFLLSKSNIFQRLYSWMWRSNFTKVPSIYSNFIKCWSNLGQFLEYLIVTRSCFVWLIFLIKTRLGIVSPCTNSWLYGSYKLMWQACSRITQFQITSLIWSKRKPENLLSSQE